MHEAEARALRRAVTILVAVSAARWAWSPEAPSPPGGMEVLPELLAESEALAEEEALRSAPLEPGERIDPNRADEVQLDRLPGVGPATARAILAARDTGLVFRTPEDLTAVRGIGPATVQRLGPVLDLDAPPLVGMDRRPVAFRSSTGRPGPTPVDLNRAGPEELERLPGIGPALAARIVEERGKRMFMSLDDLLRVRGVGPATVERLRGIAHAGGAR